MAQTKKIIGLSTGRINGNSEILLKEALMATEEFGIPSEIIRAMELTVRPCTGCEACSMAMARGQEAQCTIKDDDVPWILDKTVVEDCALIVSAPVYHLRTNSYFEAIHERMLPTMFRNPTVLEKTRVGAIISVGGGEPEWTPLGLTSINIFMQHTRKLVDQMQVNFVGRPGTVLMEDRYMERARKLGQNIALALMKPIEEVEYVGDNTEVSCPICHCNVLKVPENLPIVYCPVCWIRGELSMSGTKMKIDWKKDDIENPRFSPKFVGQHLEFIGNLQKKFFTQDQETVKERIKKYVSWGNIVKP